MVNALVIRRNTQLEKPRGHFTRRDVCEWRPIFSDTRSRAKLPQLQRMLNNVTSQSSELLRRRTQWSEDQRAPWPEIELLEDVQSGHADFDHILVYDVSRC